MLGGFGEKKQRTDGEATPDTDTATSTRVQPSHTHFGVTADYTLGYQVNRMILNTYIKSLRSGF